MILAGGTSASDSSPESRIPFDDADPAVNQDALAREVQTFLETLDGRWGASPETIRTRVIGRLERDDRDVLIYTRTLADHGVLEGYDFRGGSLVRGQYVYLQRPVNGLNEFIDYYAAVKRVISDLYGAPAVDHTIWDNDLYQPLPDYWGVAVQMGHLRYAATWEMAAGVITMELTGNHHSRLTIEYRSTAFTGSTSAA